MNEKKDYSINEILIRRLNNNKLKKIKKINLKKYSNISDKNIKNTSSEKKNLNKKLIHSFSYTNYNDSKYWHLLNGKSHSNQSGMDWIKHLRYYQNKNLKVKENIYPPSFYNNDLKNYMKKMKKKSNSSNYINNFIDLSYLTKNNINGKPNIHELKYFSNLREVKLRNNLSFVNPNKWKNTNFLSSRDLYSYLPAQKSLDENLIIRPYNKIIRQSFYGEKNKIIKKNLIKDKILAMNYLGEHKSELPYTERYKENFNSIIKGESNNINIYNYLFGLRVYDPIRKITNLKKIN